MYPVESGQSVHITSPIRRKPRTTYKSPSSGELYTSWTFASTTISQEIGSSSSSSSTSIPISLKGLPPTLQINETHTLQKRKRYTMSPLLPLYHPLGRLALSLPPLDPASVGLPTPARSDDAARRSSARARRPVAKLRDVEEESPQVAPASIPGVDTPEPQKPSPRKRRAGGGGGSKRKRGGMDDGDATYPAKRTRAPRSSATQNQNGDDESESVPPIPEVTPTPEPNGEGAEDKRPERRTTRSKGTRRRDSSASEAGSTLSASVGAIASMDGVKEPKTTELDGESQLSGDEKLRDEKEDGEVSEEGRPNPSK